MCVLPVEGMDIGRQLFLKFNNPKRLWTKVFNVIAISTSILKNKQVIEDKYMCNTTLKKKGIAIGNPNISSNKSGGVGEFDGHDGRNCPMKKQDLENQRKKLEALKKSEANHQTVILFSIHNDEWKSFQCHHQTALRSYALSWKPCQGDSLNLPDHRIHKDGDGDASFQLESNSLPHAHAQTTKTYYKHQDSRIMKAQELKTKTSAQTLIYKIFLQRYQVYQGRLLASFQDDAKYEHVGQDTRSQGGKDDQDKQGKDLKISDKKTKSKDNDKG
ncbi:hypothetical protein Tco_0469313 [Tanacetum coccineum]